MTKRIILTVTNDLNFDQRMRRICTSLHDAGYDVTLVGRVHKKSQELIAQPYKQVRLPMFAQKGKSFYTEYNARLYAYLMKTSTDAICSIDLDTIVPGYLASSIKKNRRVYDAHELFCEMEEIISRPSIYKFWKQIEKRTLPHYKHGYTVSGSYADQYEKMYRNRYEIVRNATQLDSHPLPPNQKKYILYQGAVNEGRCFEQLIPAMQYVDFPLVICGDGNYMSQTQELISQYGLESKVTLAGYIPPDELKSYTQNALCGITLFTSKSKSNYYSLANRFFDYIHQGIPQLAVALPEYLKINEEYEVANLIEQEDIEPKRIAKELNTLINDKDYHNRLSQNTQACKQKYNWQNEEKTLLRVWEQVFST